VNRNINPLSDSAIVYSWHQLAKRAGVTRKSKLSKNNLKILDLPVYHDYPENLEVDSPSIIVTPCAPEAWHQLLSREPYSLPQLPIKEIIPDNSQIAVEDSIPVLFWGAGYEDSHKPFVERREDGSVIFHADIIAATFFMLTRWEETIIPDRDEHGRFPATASVAYKQGFLNRPIVDEYALILRSWLQVLLPNWQPQRGHFSVKLSHDIDHLRSFPNYYSALRTFAHHTIKQPNLQRASETLREVLIQTILPKQTAYFKGVHELMQISHQWGLNNDAFYFMTAQPRPMENEYSITSPIVKKLIKEVQDQGFEIGLHAGYNSANNPSMLKKQKEALTALLGEDPLGGRQHYLRFQVPDTWRHWEAAGFLYDATLGHADHEGFRAGTCRRYQPFDIEQDRQMCIWEEPLIVMDGTLRSARKMSPDQALVQIKKLARRCQMVEGTFTLLWHNSSLRGEWTPWVQTYRDIVKHLGEPML